MDVILDKGYHVMCDRTSSCTKGTLIGCLPLLPLRPEPWASATSSLGCLDQGNSQRIPHTSILRFEPYVELFPHNLVSLREIGNRYR